MSRVFNSLRVRILLLFGMVFMVVLVVAGLRAYERRNADIAHGMARLQFHADIITEKQQETVQHTLGALALVADVADLAPLSQNPRCQQVLAHYLAHRSHLSNLFIASPTGEVLCSATPLAASSGLASQDYVRAARASRTPVIGAALRDPVSGKWMLPLGLSMRNAAGQVTGILGAYLNLAWVNQAFRKVLAFPDMRLGLVTAQGMILAHYPEPEKWVGQDISHFPDIKQLVAHGTKGAAEAITHDGETRIYALVQFAHTESGPIYLWLNVPRSIVTGSADRHFIINALITLALVVLTFAAAWYGGNRLLVQPINQLVNAARRLSQGHAPERSGLPHSRNEIGELARSFDDMAQALMSKNAVLRLNRALRVMGACNKALVYAQSESALLDEVCALLVAEGGYRMAWVGYAGNPAPDVLHPVIWQSGKSVSAADEVVFQRDRASLDSLVWLVLQTGQPQLNQPFVHPPDPTRWRDAPRKSSHRACSVFPLKDKSRVFGVLVIYADGQTPFNADETQWLRELTDSLVFGIFAQRTDAAHRHSEQELANYRDHLEQLVYERTQALAAALTQANAANRAKSAFLSNMSHELRTPLNAVIGFSRLMTRSAHLDAGEKKNLEIINRSGNHLLTLINDVLELSKIEAGQVALTETSSDVAELAREVTDMLRPRAEQGGLMLTLDMPALPAMVRVDTIKLRQILINLLGNAIKFTRQGSVTLAIQTCPAAAGQVGMIFRVCDTGIGIAEQDRQKIFEPFVQMVTHATTSGTGLGLAITRQYLQMLGSGLEIESTPGEGSCFHFTLQLPVVDTGVCLVGACPAETHLAPTSRGKRILIADDNADARQLLVQLLQPLGFATAEAVDGASAIALTRQFQPELIVMDWRMPGMDGLEATRHIRALPLGVQPKILMLSASAFAEEREVAFVAGIDDFLSKPVQEAPLLDAISRLLHLSLAPHAATPAPVGDVALSASMLTVLSDAQRDALRIAVEELNRVKVNAVLADIAEAHPTLARQIHQLADCFRYKELWELLDAP